MKRLTSLLLVITVLALLLAACAQPTPEVIEKEVVVEKVVKETVVVEKEKVVEKEVVVTVEVEVPEEEPTPLPAGAIQVNFWHAMGGWRVPVIGAMANDFNVQHPGIVVLAEHKGGYRDIIQAAIQSASAGEPPHVSQIYEAGTQLALDTEIWKAAEDVVAECGIEVDWSQYLDAAMSYYTIEGKHYSFPWNTSTPIMFYNKTMFDEAGLEMPRYPTYDDVVALGQALVDGGYAEYAITWPSHSWFVENWFAEQGADLVDMNNSQDGRPTEIYWTGDASKRLFTWWAQLYADGLWVNPGFEAWGEAKKVFLSEKAGMLLYSTSAVKNLESDGRELGFEVDTAFLPAPSAEEREGVVIGGASLYIADGLPKDEMCAAAEFVLWMSATPQTIRWHQNTGYFPITKTAVDVLEAEGWFEANPDFRTAFNQLMETNVSRATQGAKFGALLEVRTIIIKQFEQIMADIDAGMSVAEAVETNLAAAKEASDAAIADYEASVGK